MSLFNRKRIIIKCDCAVEALEFVYSPKTEQDPYTEMFISIYKMAFYTEQEGIWYKFVARLKFIWYAILGKEFRLEEVYLDEKEIIQLKEYFASLDIIGNGFCPICGNGLSQEGKCWINHDKM